MKKLLFFLILVLSIIFNTGCDLSNTTPGGTPPEDLSHTHIDNDSSGECDRCGISVVVCIDFYALNDLHGKFDDTDSQPGVDELSTYLELSHTKDENVIILSSGDMWQGSSESNMTEGMIITDWMNSQGVVSMTLGNHEFDWGEDAIKENLEIAEFPFLAINIFDKDTDTLKEYCTPSVTVERGGIKIGIIGAIGDCYSSISKDKTEDIYFKVGDELTELVKREAERLRAEGAEYIVYSLHDGYGQSRGGKGAISDSELRGYYDAVLSSGYVDLVFEGHTHQSYVLKDGSGVYHLQGGGDNKGITHVEVSINYANDTSFVSTAEFVSSTVYKNFEDSDIVDSLLSKYEDRIAASQTVLGNNVRYRSSDELRELAARLYYEFGTEEWGDEYEIYLGGGFFQTRSPYSISAGEVKYADIQMLFPFDNQLTLCSIRGSDLKRRFLETDNGNYFIYSDSPISSSEITDSKTYYIVVDSYTAYYAPNRLTIVKMYDEKLYARDLIAEYIKDGGFE